MKITELKRELMLLIDTDSPFEVEKVERYIKLVQLSKKLSADISAHGTMTTVENGSQKYIKSNPAIGEKIKVNQALIKLGEFFESRREAQRTNEKELNFADPSDFLG